MTKAGHATGDDEQVLRRELATEQAHVDLVYRELDKARERAELVATEGLSRGRTDRTGDIRDEEITGLFERDALVFNAGRRRASLDRQHEGLVFGRLDLRHDTASGRAASPGDDEEVRYIGRLGVRDDEYEALVIDWRAPAAAAFYRATPTEPMGVVRRRVLRSTGREVIGIEDDLMVPEAPEGMVVLGDGALLAALGRSRTGGMRDIVATIQAHQDEAIRAPARGVTLITGGPGTGKTVVALHRAAYLLYSDRRRYEGGGVLVVGPSAAYTAYIERVLPSLGEDSVSLRSLGDVVEAVTADRLDTPAVSEIKGSTRMVKFLARAARDSIPGAPEELRVFIAGHPVRLRRNDLDRLRGQVLRRHQRNNSGKAMRAALAQLAWQQVREGDQEEFFEKFHDSLDVDAFLASWWRPVDPREVLLWCRDATRARRYGRDLIDEQQADAFAASMQLAVDTATWSVADAALIDTLVARVGPVPEDAGEERGFYEVELLDDAEAEAVSRGALRSSDSPLRAPAGSPYRERTARDASTRSEDDRIAILLQGRIDTHDEFAHILIDEAQDLSPMQWRMIGRRGRWASWTVVGDAAQASWPDQEEALEAQNEAFGTGPRRHFRMTTNYRNAKEIFDVAAELIREVMPDADIPDAVRITGVEPVQRRLVLGEFARDDRAALVVGAVAESLAALGAEVPGSIAVIAPSTWGPALERALAAGTLTASCDDATGVAARVQVLDAMTTKGLEYDATVVVDPDNIIAESPGGAHVLYVALTRAAHRMHVLRMA